MSFGLIGVILLLACRLSADKAEHNSELQPRPIAALQPFLRYELGP